MFNDYNSLVRIIQNVRGIYFCFLAFSCFLLFRSFLLLSRIRQLLEMFPYSRELCRRRSSNSAGGSKVPRRRYRTGSRFLSFAFLRCHRSLFSLKNQQAFFHFTLSSLYVSELTFVTKYIHSCFSSFPAPRDLNERFRFVVCLINGPCCLVWEKFLSTIYPTSFSVTRWDPVILSENFSPSRPLNTDFDSAVNHGPLDRDYFYCVVIMKLRIESQPFDPSQ